jgi:metallophosphoesterase superfamily enzyme
LGIGIVGDNQTEITPLQRQIFESQKRLEAEKKQEQMDQAKGNSSSGRRKNQMDGASRSETVRYNSDGDREDDDEVMDVI